MYFINSDSILLLNNLEVKLFDNKFNLISSIEIEGIDHNFISSNNKDTIYIQADFSILKFYKNFTFIGQYYLSYKPIIYLDNVIFCKNYFSVDHENWNFLGYYENIFIGYNNIVYFIGLYNYYSLDNGKTIVKSNNDSKYKLYSYNSKELIAVNKDNKVNSVEYYYSNDEGKTWKVINLPNKHQKIDYFSAGINEFICVRNA